MSREAQAGPAAVSSIQRGERFAVGLRVRGRYRVVSEIGAGAFGTVCLAEDESTGHRVAIRFFPRSFADAPQASQAVLRMARSIIAASNSHPGMVRVLELGEVDAGRPFAVVELVEGRKLSEIMADRVPLDVPAALRLALELGGAVETLHNMGFIHGALSPRNVMVLEDGRVKLMDIELAGLRDARETQGLITGEPQAEYLSPEQILKAPVSEKTDIYAFGAILHELLCGAPPFQASTREAVLAKHLKEAPAPIHRRNGVPGSVARAVTLALYKQPEPRPLMGDVLNLLWTGAHGPAPQRKRAAVIAGGAALATLAVVAVVWGVLALRPSAPSSLGPNARPSIEPAPASPPPASTAPAIETRSAPVVKPPTPVVAPPPVAERAPVSPPPTPTVRAPAAAVAPTVQPKAPAVMPPTVERPTVSARPPAPVPPTAPPPTESRPAHAVRPSTPAVVPPARPATPPPASASAQPRVERREQPQASQAPVVTPPPQPAPSNDAEDPRAVIDWLIKPRGQ